MVRHGETLFNLLHRHQGWCDSPLTENGIQQAKYLQLGMKDIPFTKAYSSTSERAIDTANIILEGRNIQLKSSKEFKEIYFGSQEGMIREEANEKLMTLIPKEDDEAAAIRFTKSVYKIYDEAKNEDIILLVGHGMIFFLTYVLYLGIDIHRRFEKSNWDQIPIHQVRNCSVFKLEIIDGKWNYLEVDNTEYLEKGEKIWNISN